MTSQIDFQILALQSAIDVLHERINQLRGNGHVPRTSAKTEQTIQKKRGRKPGTVMSPEARERIRDAQQKRWALARKQTAEIAQAAGAAEEVPTPVEETQAPAEPPRRPKKKKA